MNTKHKELAVQALVQAKGDNSARARRMFACMDDATLNAEYGQSGLSCAQIHADYTARDAKYDAAIAWVSSQD